MEESEMISLLRRIEKRIETLERYARFQAKYAIESELKKVATTPERQQMWRLADGTLSNAQIASKIGVTLRSVQYFMQEAENAWLIVMKKRGYPKRIEDIVPLEWKPWKPKKVQVETQQEIKTETMEEGSNVEE